MAAVHPFTEGELALAGVHTRRTLGGVARISVAPHQEVLDFIVRRRGAVRRVGWVDAHIVFAALSGGYDLMTYDTHQAGFFTSARR